MNAEALVHAIQSCRALAQELTSFADEGDQFIHHCPDAGLGIRHQVSEARARAIGLKAAASCAEQMLHALEVHPVIEIPRAKLGDRVARLINRVRRADARAV